MPRLLPEHVHAYLGLLTQVSQTNSEIVAQAVAGSTPKWAVRGDRFSIVNGRKYLKVVNTNINDDGSDGQRFVHCFIDKSNGDIIKAAGWNAPQRDKDGLAVRGNIATEEGRSIIWKRLLADPAQIHGHYLYK